MKIYVNVYFWHENHINVEVCHAWTNLQQGWIPGKGGGAPEQGGPLRRGQEEQGVVALRHHEPRVELLVGQVRVAAGLERILSPATEAAQW